ncbi:metal-dependent hydrolase [Escherichia coli]|nr:metal-dependent hydrolase [Escherichia coli]
MQKSFRFTNSSIKALPANTDTRSTELEVSDTEVIGLKCLSGRTGNKRFLLRYTFHGTKKSISIGRFPEIDVGTARQIARRHKEAIALGNDPKAERDNYRAMPTLSEFFHQTYVPFIKRHKKSWDKDVQRFTQYIVPRQYVSGESHYYLGKQYQLKVTEDATVPQRVKMLRGRLEVTVRHKSAEKVKALLTEWYRERARDVFQRRLDSLIPQTLWVSERPPIRLRAMQTQWGNCSAKGCLTLNPWLVKASSECIDYVLLHELCHVAEHNHSEEFYRLMGQVMPGWEKVKKRLDGMAAMLLTDM